MKKAVRWAETYVQADLMYFVTGGSWLALGQVINSLTSFLLALAMANLLPKEIFGTYRYILSIAGLLSIFTLPGMNTALVRAVSRGAEGTLSLAAGMRVRGALVGSIAAMGGALYYYFAGNVTLALSLVIVALFLPIFDTFTTFTFFLQGKRDFRALTAANNVINIGTFFAIAAATFLTKSLFLILIAYFGSYAVLRGGYFIFSLKRSVGASDDGLVRYGFHLSLIGILSLIAENIDKVLLFHYLGPAEVALYYIATALPDQAKSAIGLIDTLVLPKLASHPEDVAKRTVKEKLPLFMMFGLIVVAAYVLLAPFVFRWFFPSYVGVIVLSQVFALSMVNSAVASPLASFLSAHGKVRAQYWIGTLTNVFQIISMVLLTKFAGLTGLVIARVLSRFFGGVMNWYFFSFYREESAR